MATTSSAEAIETIIRGQFPDADLVDIHIEDGEDADGDAILKITIVFETAATIDPKKATGLASRIRPELTALADKRFPMLRLITRDDAEV